MAELKIRRLIVLALSTVAAVVYSTAAWAQGAPAAAAPAVPGAQQEDPFTVEALIGNAVSLSNQKYPEIEKAIQRFKNGDGEGAREFLDLAKQKYPKLPPTDLTFAKLHLLNRNGDAMQFWLETAATNNPDDPEAYLMMADQAFSQGQTAESQALFEKAERLSEKFTANPKRKRNFDIRVLAGLSAVHERRQQPEAAEALLKKWLALDPDSAAAHTRYGMVLFKLKKVDEAFNEFTQARKLQPDASNPDIVLGQLYSQGGDVDKARKAFQKAYNAEPDNEATARSYADWLIQQDDLSEAQKVAAALRKKSPDSVTSLLLEGLVSKMRGDRKGAEESLTKALTLDPANAGATNLLALLLIDSPNMSDKEKALRYAQVNAQRFPNSSQAQITLAWVLFEIGRPSEGNEALQRGAQAGQLNADSAYLVARIFAKQGRKDNARAALDAMLKQVGGGSFMYRKDAEALLKELQAAGVQAPAAEPPAGTPPATSSGTGP
jgi:tetratricopeptide (TPR) repeat protein